MNKNKILFLGYNPQRMGSVRVRCQDIAQRLGCDTNYVACTADEIPDSYQAFICVKPSLSPPELEKLKKRGLVIWDVLDLPPPPETAVSAYLTSTCHAARALGTTARVFTIPHYHCNFAGQPTPGVRRNAGWLGNRHWYPSFCGLEHDVHLVDDQQRPEIARRYKQIGILLNFRSHSFPDVETHIKFNSGIKLINAIGFGIPSICAEEPAYREIGEECAVFCDISECASWLSEVQRNSALFHRMRTACLERARLYHIATIADQYRRMFREL